jgi:predicted MFS family arabinose efflux permease
MSTAWVVPGLLGPGIASTVSNAFGWRWVFLGIVPFAVVAGAIAYRPLRPLQIVDGEPTPSRLREALRVAVGAGLVLGGLTADTFLLAIPLVVAGAIVAAPAFLALVPSGTLRAAPGLPAATLARGILTFAFFGADAYIPLAITDARGSSTLFAGVALTASALSWTAGSWLQERLVGRVGARRFVSAGHAVLLAGIGAAALVLWDAVPLFVIAVAWTIAGFGIGMSYAPISLTVLREAPSGQEGVATSGMQLTDLLGVSLGTGFGGAAVALGDTLGWSPKAGIGIAWGMAAAMALLGVAVGRRLPGPSGEAEEPRGVAAEHGLLAGG